MPIHQMPTKEELKQKCRDKGISGFSKLNKPELEDLCNRSSKLVKANGHSTLKRSSHSMKATSKVDSAVPKSANYKVEGTYAVKLNQTNIGGNDNNNKYYILQLLVRNSKKDYSLWTRWGRVGPYTAGTSLINYGPDLEKAVKEFEKKFKQKTGNHFGAVATSTFSAKSGKYKLVETVDSDDSTTADSPLGKLNKAQILKGQAVLEKLSKVLKRSHTADVIAQLSGEYYSLIPVTTGFKKPPPIDTAVKVETKREYLNFLLRMGCEDLSDKKTLAPIDGIKESALPTTLLDAVTKKPYDVCKKHYVEQATTRGVKLHRSKKKLPSELYSALALYTGDGIYGDLNTALRSANRKKVAPYFRYLRMIFEAFAKKKKSNKAKVTLYRGVCADLQAEYTVGKTVCWWGVSSCTSDKGVAASFSSGCSSTSTLFTIQCTSAMDVQDVSLYPSEKESLLPPGTKLKVVSSSKKGNVHHIGLVEVGQSVS